MKKSSNYKLDKNWISKPSWHLASAFLLMVLVTQVFYSNPVYAQSTSKITVTGKITDEHGEGLVGVNIVPTKSQQMGTITDMSGDYRITVPGDEILRVSYIGFAPQDVEVNNRSSITIVMDMGNSDLEEVVVVGYGSVKRANLLGAVSSITAKELEDYPVTTLSSMLDGKMAGVSVSPSQPTGKPGASTRITVRGERTYGSANQGTKEPSPLYIVDGMEYDSDAFNMLDPNEIESISVLKDASAAVYGARGSNGVMLVQTKRGKEGKIRVSYSGSYGIGEATQQTEMLSAYEQASYLDYLDQKSMGDNYESSRRFSESDLEAMKNVNYDWLDGLWKPSSQKRHALSISGGTDKVRYNASGTYVKENGNFDNLSVEKYSFRLGLDADVTDDLTVSVGISLGNKVDKMPYGKAEGIGDTMEKTFQQLLQTPKWLPASIGDMYVGNDLSWNTYALINSNSYKRGETRDNTVNFKAKYKVPYFKGLEASVQYSRQEGHNYSKKYLVPYKLYNFSNVQDSKYLLSENVISEDIIENTDRIEESYVFNKGYQLNFNLNYQKQIKSHTIKAFISSEISEGEGYGFGAIAYEQQLQGIETQKAFLYNNAATSDGSLSESGSRATIGRLNYSYADKYLFEGTFRQEFATEFHPSIRKGLFPAGAIGWVASEEPFIKNNIYFVDFLKFRFSYGRTGRNYLKAYEYLLQYGPSGSYLMGNEVVTGLNVQNYGVVSTGVTWEKSDMANFGIDIKLFKSRLGVTLDMFYNHTFDVLSQPNVIPLTTGVSKMVSQNTGSLESWGYDMELSYNGKIGKDFKWNVKGLFVFNTNRILYQPSQYLESDFRYPEGKSTYTLGREQGYVTNGIIRTQAQLDAINADWNEKWGHDYILFGQAAQVGMLYFQDIGRDGKSGEPTYVHEADGIVNNYDFDYITDANDNFVLKNLLPTTVTIGASWKKITMSMQYNLAYGTTSSIYDKLARTAPSITENAPAFYSDYWTPDNTDAFLPAPEYSTMNSLPSTFWVRKDYMLRLRNLSIAYTLPTTLTDRWGIAGLKVYFSGTNLWTPISTFDYKEDAISRYNTYPFLKTYNFGLNVSL